MAFNFAVSSKNQEVINACWRVQKTMHVFNMNGVTLTYEIAKADDSANADKVRIAVCIDGKDDEKQKLEDILKRDFGDLLPEKYNLKR